MAAASVPAGHAKLPSLAQVAATGSVAFGSPHEWTHAVNPFEASHRAPAGGGESLSSLEHPPPMKRAPTRMERSAGQTQEAKRRQRASRARLGMRSSCAGRWPRGKSAPRRAPQPRSVRARSSIDATAAAAPLFWHYFHPSLASRCPEQSRIPGHGNVAAVGRAFALRRGTSCGALCPQSSTVDVWHPSRRSSRSPLPRRSAPATRQRRMPRGGEEEGAARGGDIVGRSDPRLIGTPRRGATSARCERQRASNTPAHRGSMRASASERIPRWPDASAASEQAPPHVSGSRARCRSPRGGRRWGGSGRP